MDRRILWTGGFDSTWLVIDALQAGDRVQAFAWTRGGSLEVPKGKARAEAVARDRIAAMLPTGLRRKLTCEVVEDSQVAGQWHWLWEEMTAAAPGRWWTPQNYVLASLPRLFGSVEAGLVADDHTAQEPGIVTILRREGLALPIVGQTKRDLLVAARRRGLEPFLALTWSCEGTTAGEACGECDACRSRLVAAVTAE